MTCRMHPVFMLFRAKAVAAIMPKAGAGYDEYGKENTKQRVSGG